MAKRKATRKKAAKRKAAPKKAAKKKAARKKAARKAAPKKAAKKKAAKKKASKKKASKKKATRKKGSKKKAAKKKAKKKAARAKRKPNPSFMKPLTPDAALAAVVGTKPLPRTEVVKKLWSYIKRKDLQNKQNKRMINADDKLRDLFGGKKQVSMFEMTKLVSQHLA